MSDTSTRDRPIRILLVEDDNHIGRIIELSLPDLGVPYTFTAVLSAEEGLRLWQEASFDLLITDYNLRGLSGLQMVESLRQSGAQVPVLLVTAYDSAEVRKEARAQRVDAYITKPFFMDDLIETVRRLIPANAAREVNGG